MITLCYVTVHDNLCLQIDHEDRFSRFASLINSCLHVCYDKHIHRQIVGFKILLAIVRLPVVVSFA